MQRHFAHCATGFAIALKRMVFLIALALCTAIFPHGVNAQASNPLPATVTAIQLPSLSLGVVILPNGKALNLSVGAGSAAFRGKNDLPGRIWLMTDRGPNIDCNESRRFLGLDPEQACGGDRNGRIYPLPGFAPSIYAADIGSDNTARYNVFIPLKGRSGKPVSGRPPLATGRYEPALGVDGKSLPPDPSGIDPEGLVRLADGSFWIAEELGPSLLHVAADGTILKRLVPQGTQADFKDADYDIVPSLPAILRQRAPNRGFEGLALSPDEKFLYVMTQGALANPDIDTSRRSRHLRIWKVARETGEVVLQFLYATDMASTYTSENDGRERTQARVIVSEISAIADDHLLVLERIERHMRLYSVKLQDENRIPRLFENPDYGPGLEWLETERLAVRGISPVSKNLVIDSDQVSGLPPRAEGMAIISPTEILIINDNDFGIDGVRTNLFRVTLTEPLIR
ncbi:Phytase-like domain containing protein [Rhabdaerophilaceae bacterium]